MSNTKIWAITIVCFLCGWFLLVAVSSLMPVLWAICIAYFIHPLVLLIQKQFKLKKKIFAVIATYAILIVLFSILINSFMPPLINQMVGFAREFSGYSQQIIGLVDELLEYLDTLGLDARLAGQLDDVLMQLFSIVSNLVMNAVTSVISYIGKLTDFVIVAVLLFLFLLDGPEMAGYIINYLPEKLREATNNIMDGLGRVIWGYLRNQVLISVVTGIVTATAFTILGLPFAGLQGVLATVLNMIPFVGSIISGTVNILVALYYFSMQKVLVTLAVVLTINLVLGSILTPMVQAETIGMHPVVVIASLLVCNYLWGPIGMFIAVPLVGLCQLLMREVIRIIKML